LAFEEGEEEEVEGGAIEEADAYAMTLLGVAAAAFTVTGYSDGKMFFTSWGRFLYQSGSTLPVGSAILEPVGIAV